ncbi:MAG: GEVED domain-containing protein [Planctomycetaceae bacterium]
MLAAEELGAEIAVSHEGREIIDGRIDRVWLDTSQLNGSSLPQTFRVSNDGVAPLITGSMTIPDGFRLTEELQPTIEPGSFDTFSVELDTSFVGTHFGQIVFATNDLDESDYSLTVIGIVTPTTHRVSAGFEDHDDPWYVASQQPGTWSSPNFGVVAGHAIFDNLRLKGSVDWFRFETTEEGAGLHYVSVSSYMDLELYDASLTRLDVSDDTLIYGDQKRISLGTLPAGAYFVKVTRRTSNHGAAYSMVIKPPGSGVDDSFESNDTAEQTALRTPGETNSANLGILTSRRVMNNLYLLDANDWFRFETIATGTADHSVSVSHKWAQHMSMALYDANRNLLANADAGSGYGQSISLNDLPSGVYYLRVFRFVGLASSGYTLAITPPTSEDKLSITFSTASISEGDGKEAAIGTVRRTGSLSKAVLVRLKSSDITELKVPKQVNIPVGQESVSFSIDAVDDHRFDRSKEVFVTAGADAYESGSAAMAVSGDSKVSLSATDSVHPEGTWEKTYATFTLTRHGDLSTGASVSYAVTGSSPVPANAEDFGGTLPFGVVHFLPRQVSALLKIEIANDYTVEGNDVFTLTLSDATRGMRIDNGTAQGTIMNDDLAAFRPDRFQVTVSETSQTAMFGIYLGVQPLSDVVVNVTSADTGEAVVDRETVVFTPENWHKTQFVTVSGVDDFEVDGDQRTTITLSIDDALSDDAFDSLRDSGVSVITMDGEGVVPLFDFGDAPATYPVKREQDGARHRRGTLFLGAAVDDEVNGIPSDNADSDVSDDGISFQSTLFSVGVTTRSSVGIIASDFGQVDGWIDFNGDGDWNDAGEQVLTSVLVNPGSNLHNFFIPPSIATGRTVARFRISSVGFLTPTGVANDGEVEDYVVTILSAIENAALEITIPRGDISVLVEGDDVVFLHGAEILFQGPVSSFNELHFGGSPLDDIFEFTIPESLEHRARRFDGGLGKDFIKLAHAGQVLDLRAANLSLIDVEGIDITGSGNNTLVLDTEEVKSASSTTDTLEVIANHDDEIQFGFGWKVEAPRFIDGATIHVITESAPGGSARIELRNDLQFQNPLLAEDVDRDGRVLPLDALRIINALSRRDRARADVPDTDVEVSRFYLDVSGDQLVTALDALRVINALARDSRGGNSESQTTTSFGVQPMLATRESEHLTRVWSQEIIPMNMLTTTAKRTIVVQHINVTDQAIQDFGIDDEAAERDTVIKLFSEIC